MPGLWARQDEEMCGFCRASATRRRPVGRDRLGEVAACWGQQALPKRGVSRMQVRLWRLTGDGAPTDGSPASIMASLESRTGNLCAACLCV